MARLCINYDLNKQGKDYSGLIAELTRMGAAEACRSTWLLDTAQTEAQVHARLSPHLDQDDFYFSVVIAQRPFWTRLLVPGARWMQARWTWP